MAIASKTTTVGWVWPGVPSHAILLTSTEETHRKKTPSKKIQIRAKSINTEYFEINAYKPVFLNQFLRKYFDF